MEVISYDDLMSVARECSARFGDEKLGIRFELKRYEVIEEAL